MCARGGSAHRGRAVAAHLRPADPALVAGLAPEIVVDHDRPADPVRGHLAADRHYVAGGLVPGDDRLWKARPSEGVQVRSTHSGRLDFDDDLVALRSWVRELREL